MVTSGARPRGRLALPVREAAARRARERGASVVELAILMPVVLIVILLIVQFALIFHARQVADAAAREGARVARAAGVGEGAGDWQGAATQRARTIIGAMGPQILTKASVQPWQRGSHRGVTVRGDAVAAVPLLPGMSFRITSTFGGPIECFRPDDGSGGCG
ncbi:TadE family protein [Thermoactinospora rubra]|uniref:TadE family protein n=1 Tax=Thermoactinospora rubra TaxID=1088767 RepID=UPI001F0A6972|nr:TadE family protein [Thermoactinospora rubra]